MTDIGVAIEALRSDARIWEQAAEDLADPASAVGPLALNGSPDVMMYGADIGIDTTYNESRAAIEDLLGKAVGYFRELADTLVSVAANYEEGEAEGATGFRQRESALEGE
ncbi:MAG: hypothetical protein GEU86_22165 [Actinophytocola sp.]|nr:hypothetical protein [Actinophytocola sp.]